MVSVEAEVSVDSVLERLTSEELAQIIAEREKHRTEQPEVLLQKVYEHFHVKGGAPQCLSDYIWAVLGKQL